MPLNPNQHQGGFGEVFVQALAVAAGLTVAKPYPDASGDDYTLGYPGELDGIRHPKVDLQVKSWSAFRQAYSDGHWNFPMRVEHFNNLAGTNYTVPRFLILVLVPADPSDFVDARHGELVLKHSAYWVSLQGRARINVANQSKVTVQIPEENLLTVHKLLDLMKASNPGWVRV